MDETRFGLFVDLYGACRTITRHKLARYVRYTRRLSLNLIRYELLLRCSAAIVNNTHSTQPCTRHDTLLLATTSAPLQCCGCFSFCAKRDENTVDTRHACCTKRTTTVAHVSHSKQDKCQKWRKDVLRHVGSPKQLGSQTFQLLNHGNLWTC